MGEWRVMQEALFYGFSLERCVPDNHLLRRIAIGCHSAWGLNADRRDKILKGVVTLSKRRREAGLLCENFKRPQRPRATWSSQRRGARGAIELI
jgi:hypothetical protein